MTLVLAIACGSGAKFVINMLACCILAKHKFGRAHWGMRARRVHRCTHWPSQECSSSSTKWLCAVLPRLAARQGDRIVEAVTLKPSGKRPQG